MHQGELVPNVHLRRARSLKGWSQAELAEQIGTSFEMVSRWERGITVPSVYYRERLCAVLDQTAEELDLLRGHTDAVTPLPSQLVFLASAHTDAEKPIVSHLRTTLQDRESRFGTAVNSADRETGTHELLCEKPCEPPRSSW